MNAAPGLRRRPPLGSRRPTQRARIETCPAEALARRRNDSFLRQRERHDRAARRDEHVLPAIEHVGHRRGAPDRRAGAIGPEPLAAARVEGVEVPFLVRRQTRGPTPSTSRRRATRSGKRELPLHLAGLRASSARSALKSGSASFFMPPPVTTCPSASSGYGTACSRRTSRAPSRRTAAATDRTTAG